MRIAREGYPLIFTAVILTLLAFLAGWMPLGIILGLIGLAIAGFFRDPERQAPAGEGLVVSPADGKVVSVARVAGDSPFLGSATRVSIFLSPLDVHINRTPVDGKIAKITVSARQVFGGLQGRSFRTQRTKCPKHHRPRRKNLRGSADCRCRWRDELFVARNRGIRLARGERFGLIMFGSRTDTYLPEGCQVEVTEGQRVKGGETILARFV